MNKMGICPSTLAVTTPSGTYKSIPVPDEIRELAIAYEPVNIFKLLGFPDENVKADEFKARLEERLKMLTAKKGGATDAQRERVKAWLDTTITPANFGRITRDQIDTFFASDPDIKTSFLLREVVGELKRADATYNTVNIPGPPPVTGPSSTLSKQCKDVEEWIYTVEDIRAIKPAELKTLKAKGVNKTALDICMPKVAPGVKYGFAAEDATPVEGTATCKTLLEEAQGLVGTIRGDERFEIYRKFLKTRMANEYYSKTKTIKPLKAISDSEFLSTCVEIEKTTATGLGFPPKMINYVVLREAIDPFAFLGLPRTATPAEVKAAITSRKALLDGIDKLTKQEKASTKDLRTTCKQGLDEMQAIVDADLLEKLKGYVEMRTKKMALYPEKPMKDDEFTEYCVENIPKPSTLVSDVKSRLKTVGTATATGVKTVGTATATGVKMVYDKFMPPIPGENPTPFKNSSDRLSSKDESESSDKPGSLPEPTPSSTGLSPEEELDSMIPSTGPPPGPTAAAAPTSYSLDVDQTVAYDQATYKDTIVSYDVRGGGRCSGMHFANNPTTGYILSAAHCAVDDGSTFQYNLPAGTTLDYVNGNKGVSIANYKGLDFTADTPWRDGLIIETPNINASADNVFVLTNPEDLPDKQNVILFGNTTKPQVTKQIMTIEKAALQTFLGELYDNPSTTGNNFGYKIIPDLKTFPDKQKFIEHAQKAVLRGCPQLLPGDSGGPIIVSFDGGSKLALIGVVGQQGLAGGDCTSITSISQFIPKFQGIPVKYITYDPATNKLSYPPVPVGKRKRRQRTYRKRKGGKRRKTYRKST